MKNTVGIRHLKSLLVNFLSRLHGFKDNMGMRCKNLLRLKLIEWNLLPYYIRLDSNDYTYSLEYFGIRIILQKGVLDTLES
ncbi:Hypothetical predicted protein [Octopus vulgaris]|uniref:Uncharacterized protein n=1 Tax=Octopus vulgaris TaxID=6645 RepID=A0AA36AQI4_OCTVU|nr:Hypothetical predicted protein [Octopus vulgaris]